MAATSRFTRRCFGSSIIFPRPSSLRAQFRVFSCVPNYFSTYYVRNDASRCKTTSKIVAVSRIRSMCSESSGSELGWSVKKIIGENPVVVFSKTWCSYSMEVKSLFKGLGVEPFVVELDQLGSQGAQLQKSLEMLTGQRTVPNVFIGGKHVGGCTDTVELCEKGELKSLLLEAGATKTY